MKGHLQLCCSERVLCFSDDLLLRIYIYPKHPFEVVFPPSFSVYAHRQTWLSEVGLLSQPVYIKMSEALSFVM